MYYDLIGRAVVAGFGVVIGWIICDAAIDALD